MSEESGGRTPVVLDMLVAPKSSQDGRGLALSRHQAEDLASDMRTRGDALALEALERRFPREALPGGGGELTSPLSSSSSSSPSPWPGAASIRVDARVVHLTAATDAVFSSSSLASVGTVHHHDEEGKEEEYVVRLVVSAGSEQESGMEDVLPHFVGGGTTSRDTTRIAGNTSSVGVERAQRRGVRAAVAYVAAGILKTTGNRIRSNDSAAGSADGVSLSCPNSLLEEAYDYVDLGMSLTVLATVGGQEDPDLQCQLARCIALPRLALQVSYLRTALARSVDGTQARSDDAKGPLDGVASPVACLGAETGQGIVGGWGLSELLMPHEAAKLLRLERTVSFARMKVQVQSSPRDQS